MVIGIRTRHEKEEDVQCTMANYIVHGGSVGTIGRFCRRAQTLKIASTASKPIVRNADAGIENVDVDAPPSVRDRCVASGEIFHWNGLFAGG